MILDDSEDLPSCNLLQFAIENGHGWWIYPLKHGDVPYVFACLPEGRSEFMGRHFGFQTPSIHQ